MFERFARSARSAVEHARGEAERRGDRRIGTEHLLLALLQDQAIERLVGVDGVAAHEAADRLDRDALTAIGFDVGDLQSAGDPPLGRHVLRMTSGAKTVLQQSLAHTAAEKARAITARHILLALLDQQQPDPAATLLAALPIDQESLRKRLASAA